MRETKCTITEVNADGTDYLTVKDVEPVTSGIELVKEGHHRFLFFICSDVVFPEEEFIKQKDILLAEDFSNVGVYCPSHQKDSYTFVKWPYNQATNKKRDVPCVEAMISMWNIRVCEHIHPCIENKYGWGLDICAAYYCLQNGFKQMIDDRVSIYHPMGAVGKNEKGEIITGFYAPRSHRIIPVSNCLLQPQIFS